MYVLCSLLFIYITYSSVYKSGAVCARAREATNRVMFVVTTSNMISYTML